eukprot:10567256-Alexandrium_andersonii.AAC.1
MPVQRVETCLPGPCWRSRKWPVPEETSEGLARSCTPAPMACVGAHARSWCPGSLRWALIWAVICE